jgi:hypothetical protein
MDNQFAAHSWASQQSKDQDRQPARVVFTDGRQLKGAL